MLYEDDALRVIQTLTGLSAPDADRFRKRVGQASHRGGGPGAGRGVPGGLCRATACPDGVAVELWLQLAKFNHYSFCKSHAVSYGLIAWQAAYLKAHHPLAFWTAALNNNQGVYPRRVYVEAVKRAGIALRLPCVNRSAGPFTVEDGRPSASAWTPSPRSTRSCGRPCWRARSGTARTATWRTFAAASRRGRKRWPLLIRCGALDFTGQPRPALFLEADLQDQGRSDGRRGRLPAVNGLLPLTSVSGDWLPPDYPAERRRRDEWELLGFVVGPPLLSLFRPQLAARASSPAGELRDHVGRKVQVAGVVATARHTRDVGRARHAVRDPGGRMGADGSDALSRHLSAGGLPDAGAVPGDRGRRRGSRGGDRDGPRFPRGWR